jgi:hypothetical protein
MIFRLEDEEAPPTDRLSSSMNTLLDGTSTNDDVADDDDDDNDSDSMSDSSFNGYDALAKLSEEDFDDIHDIQEIVRHNKGQMAQGQVVLQEEGLGRI